MSNRLLKNSYFKLSNLHEKNKKSIEIKNLYFLTLTFLVILVFK